MAQYVARFEVDPGGEGWIVTVPSIPGCRSEGDTLREARDGIREALSLFVDDSDTAEIVEEVLVPESVQEEIDRHREAKALADAEATRAGELLRSAVASLTRLGLTRRDVARILGLSHQRVQQLVEGT